MACINLYAFISAFMIKLKEINIPYHVIILQLALLSKQAACGKFNVNPINGDNFSFAIFKLHGFG